MRLTEISKKLRPVWYWCMLLVGLALLLGWVSRVPLDALWSVLIHTRPEFVVLAVMLSLLASMVRTLRYGLFFPSHGRWMQLFSAFLAIRLVNSALPLRSGELASIAMLKKSGLAPDIAQTMPVWLLIRVTDVAAVSLWLTAALAISKLGEWGNAMLGAILGVPVVVLAAFAALAVWVSRNSRDHCEGWLAGRFQQLKLGFGRTRSVSAWLRTLVLSLILWGVMIGLATFIQLASRTPLGIFPCLLVSVVVVGASLLPIHAPLGIGTGETVFVATMVLFDISVQEAIPVAIAIRLILLGLLAFEGMVGFSLLVLFRNAPGSARSQEEVQKR